VGGSIAGCCAAVELTRAGFEVEVFERSRTALTGYGAGIGLMPKTVESLLRHELIDSDMPRFATRHQVLLGRASGAGRLGREALRVSMDGWCVNWADLHRNLSARVTAKNYHAGIEVCAAREDESHVELAFADGAQRRFDLAIFSDGHASLGRTLLCPELSPEYRGYVLWRGVVLSDVVADAGVLENGVFRISYPGSPGHAAFYCMPPGDGSGPLRGGLINFACYIPLEAESLERVLPSHGSRAFAG
jgi:2,6-dihydroxypyridine 3-monooxygenase